MLIIRPPVPLCGHPHHLAAALSSEDGRDLEMVPAYESNSLLH
jgi:hypothetical protein